VIRLDEREEKKLSEELAGIIDGKADAARADKDVLDALEAANLLSFGFGDEPPLNAAFDAELRKRLVSETEKRRRTARVIPFYRRQWAKLALVAALMLLVIAPSWNYMRQMELRASYRIKMQRLQKYDKMYTSRLERLRKDPDAYTKRRPMLNSRREERLAEMTNRWKIQRLDTRLDEIKRRRDRQ